MADTNAFSSVKLSAMLINSARESALAFRRSTAGQIEYWAVLGKAAEDSGLTVQEAGNAIAAYEAAAARARTLHNIEARFAAAEASGSLANRLREVVLDNRAKATAPPSRLAA